MANVEDSQTTAEAKCTLCKSEPPRLHCETCKIYLCVQCVGNHTISQLTEQHNIVAFELRNTSIKHPACTSHVNLSCELYCEDCSVPVCSQCCTDTHHDHWVTDITALYNSKQKIIRRDIEITENLILPEFEKIITNIRSQISILCNEYQKLRTYISQQGEIWHKYINTAISRYQREIDEMEIDDLAILKQQLSDMQNRSSLVMETKQSILHTLNSKDGNNLVKYELKIEETGKVPPLCQISPPTFTSLEITTESLYQQLGKLKTSIKSFSEGYIVKKALLIPEQVTNIKTAYKNLRGMKCVSRKQVWINYWDSSHIRCFDVHGSLQQTVTAKLENPSDLSITKQGHLVYTVSWFSGGGVYQVRQGKNERIITLYDWEPYGICSTTDGDLLVSMTKYKEGKIVRYHGSQIKQEIMYDDKGQHLFNSRGNLFIAENINKDVWVSDTKAEAVVVTDQSGHLKFRYTGNLESNKYEKFRPYCIESDSHGHVLVIDIFNKCVHVINRTGHLVCLIKNLSDPRGLSVDNNDFVWIGELNGEVKVIKYLMY